MRIAVTGSSGLLGGAVVSLAAQCGHTVVAIDQAEGKGAVLGEQPRGRIVSKLADASSHAELQQAMDGCEALIHLAANPSPHDAPAHRVHNNNVTSTYNALDIAASQGINRVCLASSVNAIGGAYSRRPRYNYFPLDELHATFSEDAYSLSKWIGEVQADSIARRFSNMSIASMRFHQVVKSREVARSRSGRNPEIAAKHLWGYTTEDAAARACILSLEATFVGHEIFYIVAPEIAVNQETMELCQQFYPQVPIKSDLSGNRALFDSSKAARLLAWRHDDNSDGMKSTQ